MTQPKTKLPDPIPEPSPPERRVARRLRTGIKGGPLIVSRD